MNEQEVGATERSASLNRDELSSREVVRRLEDDYDMEVLMMRDFGSHAYNLQNEDSDKDALLVFRQEPEKWLKIGDPSATEHFQRMIGDWDVQGWSLKKFAGLINSSNPTAMEFLNSPVTYYTGGKAFDAYFGSLQQYANENFNPIGLYFHYRNLAEHNYSKYVQENVTCSRWDEDERYKILEDGDGYWECDVSGSEYVLGEVETFNKDNPHVKKGTLDQTVKRNLFAARATAYAKHIRHQKTMPPMDFMEFLEHYSESAGISPEDHELLSELAGMKRGGRNDEIGNTIEQFVEDELAYEPDHEELNRRGISNERINRFIEECLR